MSYQANGKEDRYAKAPYVRLVRVSDASQEQSSDKAQLEFLKQWADERQMVLVGDYVSNNLSGSLPGNRTDLEALFERAKTKADFKYVLAQRVDRATRGGVDHLFWIEYELRKCGVKIIYPGDGLPQGIPYEQAIRAIKAEAAKEQAVSISQRSTQGSQYALERRQVSPHSRTPFGTYRLYCRSDNTPLFAIRDLRDGRQEKLSWPDLKVIDIYGQIGGKSKGRYRKQKSELVYLVPGDPSEQATVQRIFRQRYIEGLGGRTIASGLNNEGIRAPQGGKWSPHQVESIFLNEDYTGIAFANRTTAALYHARRNGRPEQLVMDDRTATTAGRIVPELRTEHDWFEQTEPYLADFLNDENVRAIAVAKQSFYWQRKLDPTWERPNKTKYPDSTYLLTDLLRAKQDGETLVGTLSGKPTHKVRMYRHKRAVREPSARNIFGKMFNADALEGAILAVLQEVLLDWPELESRVLHHVQKQMATQGQSDQLLEDKRRQQKEVRDQLLTYIRLLSPKTRDELAADIHSLEARRDTLDAEIAAIEQRQQSTTADPAAITAAIRDRLTHLAQAVPTLPPTVLKQVLLAFTHLLEADMETKQVTFAFHLPSWSVWDETETDAVQLCLRQSSEFPTEAQTHPDSELFLPIGNGKCQFKRSRGVSCNCSRSKRAA